MALSIEYRLDAAAASLRYASKVADAMQRDLRAGVITEAYATERLRELRDDRIADLAEILEEV